jgi:hypothetical protein
MTTTVESPTTNKIFQSPHFSLIKSIKYYQLTDDDEKSKKSKRRKTTTFWDTHNTNNHHHCQPCRPLHNPTHRHHPYPSYPSVKHLSSILSKYTSSRQNKRRLAHSTASHRTHTRMRPSPSTLAPAKAAASSSTASQSFSTLFRSSKYVSVTYDPSNRGIAQVITTPRHLREKGEWGLKRSLPTDLKPHTVMVSQLDEVDVKKGCVYKTASTEVSRLTRFKEVFGIGSPADTIPRESILVIEVPKKVAQAQIEAQEEAQALAQAARAEGRKEDKKAYDRILGAKLDAIGAALDEAVNFDKLSRAEFAKLVSEAASRRPEWLQTVDSKTISTSESTSESKASSTSPLWQSFLNITNKHAASKTVHPPFYKPLKSIDSSQTSIARVRQLNNLTDEQRKTLSADGKPIYQKVIAKYLNKAHRDSSQGYAVAIDGFVAFLPQKELPYEYTSAGMSRGNNPFIYERHANIEVWIKTAGFDALGRPNIEVTMKDPNVDPNQADLPSGSGIFSTSVFNTTDGSTAAGASGVGNYSMWGGAGGYGSAAEPAPRAVKGGNTVRKFDTLGGLKGAQGSGGAGGAGGSGVGGGKGFGFGSGSGAKNSSFANLLGNIRNVKPPQ